MTLGQLADTGAVRVGMSRMGSKVHVLRFTRRGAGVVVTQECDGRAIRPAVVGDPETMNLNTNEWCQRCHPTNA